MSNRNSGQIASAIKEDAVQPRANHVWYLDARDNISSGFGFRDEIWERNNTDRTELSARFNRGDKIESNELPPRMWIDRAFPGDSNRTLPHIFSAGGVLACSHAVVDALKPFDLGKSVFWPMSFFKHDRETPFEGGPFYLFQIREIKEAFSLEHSINYKPSRFENQPFVALVHGDQKDDEIKLSSGALDGADVWFDPRLASSMFVTDEVYHTLKKAKLLGETRALRCPILPESN